MGQKVIMEKTHSKFQDLIFKLEYKWEELLGNMKKYQMD